MLLKSGLTFEAEGTGTGAAPAADGGNSPAPGNAAAADASAQASNLLYPDKAADSKPAEGDKAASDAAPTEGKPDGSKDGEAAAKSDEDKAKEEAQAKLDAEVPADGKYEFKLPEGIELDKDLADRAAPVLKEAGITRAQANKLAELIATERKAEFEKLNQNWAKVQEGWQAEAKADKEIGGDKFDASIAAANKAIQKFGSDKFRDFLISSGGGNHPELIRFVARVGNAISDDKPIGSGAPAGSSKTLAEIMYPNN